jgi:hypothetical protein
VLVTPNLLLTLPTGAKESRMTSHLSTTTLRMSCQYRQTRVPSDMAIGLIEPLPNVNLVTFGRHLTVEIRDSLEQFPNCKLISEVGATRAF